ncbi:MAG: hypothetical protein KJ604_20505, partial [Gammaproteobacteria bacterium]|nr:hypothetical protein [Gammaproteobacteria bacterium]
KEVERKETPQLFIPDQSPPQKKIWIEQLNWKYLVVQEWNKIPQSFFHSHHKNMTTSLICQVAKYLEYLAQGVFFNQCNLDPDFIKKNHIPNSWITNNKKFTQREILNAIKGFSLYCQDGYWPVNKKYLPKSLLTFIYNENFETKTTTSYLLSLIANPEVKSFEEQKRLEDFNPQYTKYFIQRNLLRFFAEGDLPTVYRGIAGIETRIFRDQVFNFNGGGTPKLKEVIGEGPGKLEPMFDNYAQYLNNYNRLEPEKMFVQYKGYFQDFLESLKQHYSSFEVNI